MLGYQLSQDGKRGEETQINELYVSLTHCPPMIPVSDSLDVYRAKWLLSRGDYQAFIDWYQHKNFDIDHNYNPYYEKAYLLFSQYLYIQSRYTECLKVLTTIILEAEKSKRRYSLRLS